MGHMWTSLDEGLIPVTSEEAFCPSPHLQSFHLTFSPVRVEGVFPRNVAGGSLRFFQKKTTCGPRDPGVGVRWNGDVFYSISFMAFQLYLTMSRRQ